MLIIKNPVVGFPIPVYVRTLGTKVIVVVVVVGVGVVVVVVVVVAVRGVGIVCCHFHSRHTCSTTNKGCRRRERSYVALFGVGCCTVGRPELFSKVAISFSMLTGLFRYVQLHCMHDVLRPLPKRHPFRRKNNITGQPHAT